MSIIFYRVSKNKDKSYLAQIVDLKSKITELNYNYTNKNNLSTRILRMVTLAQKVEYVITKTEIEAFGLTIGESV